MDKSSTLVVIGAGHAGSELACGAREAGWPGRIVLIGEEPHLPYHRPPLSKACLAGDTQAPELLIRSAKAYEKAGVQMRLGIAVRAIDRAARTLALSDGSALPYDRLALATGGRARPLPCAQGAAANATNLHYLRTLQDVERLKPDFLAGRRLVVVGGGYIGLEVAASAIQRGLQVTVLESEPRVLARVTAPVMSDFYETMHRTRGVRIRTGTSVQALHLDATGQRVSAVVCADGEAIDADLVVAGIGLLPNTELAEAAGLAVDNGILVDPQARTNDPLIVAAGDCTRFHSALYGRSLRLESVPHALEQARIAAATLGGQARTHDPLPWFWSDQYDLKLKMVGLSAGHDQVVLRGDPGQSAFSAFYLQGRRLLAVDTVNRIPDFMQAKRLVAGRAEVNPEALADASIPLTQAVPIAAV